jgi:YebC/PmpR family DNA-binding regulatory protein
LNRSNRWLDIPNGQILSIEKQGKVWTKVIREITVAAKGGPDPSDNPRLRLALDKANAANMPKDTIKRAVQKGSGTGEMGVIEELTFEGYGPNGVAILVETMTDNRNRTVADVRHAFTKFGGNMGTDGSVAYLFNKLGVVQVDLTHDEDYIMEIALDAGADDFNVTEDYFEIISTPANLASITEALKKQNIETLLAENTMRADTLVNLDQEASEKVLKIMNFMDDLDDVQEVHTNAEFPEDFIDEE